MSTSIFTTMDTVPTFTLKHCLVNLANMPIFHFLTFIPIPVVKYIISTPVRHILPDKSGKSKVKQWEKIIL